MGTIKRYLTVIALVAAVIGAYLFFVKSDVEQRTSTSPVATEQESDVPQEVAIKETQEEPAALIDTVAKGEEVPPPIEQEVVESYQQQEHYDSNVEQLGREGKYKRTSYYDKPIGHISAPAVHIDEVIYAGASELNMRRGVATVEYKETLDEKTVAIAGHRSYDRTQFLTGALYLRKGMEVTVKDDLQGNQTTYVVERTYKVKPQDTYVLEDEQENPKRKLVLITCITYNPQTGKYDERFIVEAYEKT